MGLQVGAGLVAGGELAGFGQCGVEIEGWRRDEMPKAFIKLHIKHIVTGRGISEKAVADAIRLSDETYCSVAATVKPTAEITTSYEIVEA